MFLPILPCIACNSLLAITKLSPSLIPIKVSSKSARFSPGLSEALNFK